jgi:tetratricopeptide (TPR) repeat protein
VALKELAEALADDQRQAEVALRQAHYSEVTGDYRAAVVAAQNVSSEAAGYLQWGRALRHQGDYEAARTQLEQALARSKAAQLHQVEVDSLRVLGLVCWHQGDYAGTRAYFERALHICHEIGDRQGARLRCCKENRPPLFTTKM